jgi:hypothetical protein
MVEIVLILAAVCYVMVRRMLGEPAQGRRMLLLPVVLLVLGLSNVSGQAHTATSLLFLAATGSISVVMGALRGASVRLSEREGIAFVQYTGLTVALWVATLVIKFGANALFGAIDPGEAATAGSSLFLTFGASLLFEGLVVLVRTLRVDSRVIWSKGKDGQPHRMSPMLDELRVSTGGRAVGTPASSRERTSSRERRSERRSSRDHRRR